MKILNKTKNTVLAGAAEKVEGLKTKSLGLLSTAKPKAILFQTRFGIHTFGMKFPIDVIIVNSNYKVTALKQNMKPNRVFFWNPKHDLVVELPAGTIEQTKTIIDDELSID